MRNKVYEKVIAATMVMVMSGMLMTGCGNAAPESTGTQAEVTAEVADTESIEDDATAQAPAPETAEDNTAEAAEEAPYFQKGVVYVNYAKEAQAPDRNYFYVFEDATYGYTDDAKAGVGVPFSCEQTEGSVKFSFGGADSIEDVLTVSSVEDGVVTGAFEDGLELVFEPIDDAVAEGFSAENYYNGPSNSVYHDANGWSVKYDATKFTVTPEKGCVFIVYQGESAGTNVITVTYDVENTGEAAIKKLGESWGSDKTTYSEGPFPGAEDVTGYWATLPPSEDGSGLYETAIGRDYMDGALIFELTGHNGEDDAQNMEVSDQMASVIDSLTFEQ